MTNIAMGKQDGLIQITGSVGNLSFYKTQDGYLVRKKGTISADRIKSDPAFARTRENSLEFARAGRAGKLLRTTFHSLLQSASDNRVTSRLAGAMVKVIKDDAINSRGERNVIDGNTTLLEGFEFNQNAMLATTFAPLISASIDRATGNMVVSVPAFSPDEMISAPDGATHFRLKASGAAIDFKGNSYSVAIAESADLSLRNKVQEPLQLGLTIETASEHPLFLIFGIEFLQVIKAGTRYPLINGAFNAMAMIKVDGAVSKNPLPSETSGEEKKNAPRSLTPEPENQEAQQVNYDTVNEFEQRGFLAYTSTATNGAYDRNQSNVSIACDFTGYTITSPITPLPARRLG